MSRYENPNLNKWTGSEKTGLWEFWSYRYCYLVIIRLDNGKYKPLLGATANIEISGAPLPPEGYYQYDTFEQAEAHLHKYVDYTRDVWDAQAKEALNKRLHMQNPAVFPA